MRLRNTNPLGAVRVPSLGLVLDAGEDFEIDDDIAAALLEQVGNFEAAKAAPKKGTDK